MCGIICVLGDLRPRIPLSHRGPDKTCIKTLGKCYMEFTRLAINDLSEEGDQPFSTPSSLFMCNGEIYNHKDFDDRNNDCAFLPNFIEERGIEQTCHLLRGVFAMVWSDGDNVIAARDPFGVRPLFYSKVGDTICFASEIKALKGMGTPHIFPPGSFYDSLLDQFVYYYTPYVEYPRLDCRESIPFYFEQAVRRRIENTDREVGFLLSGGLDSSLVLAVTKKLFPDMKLRTFSIGQPDSPDVVNARQVAEYFKTTHTEVKFDFDVGLDVIPDVIKSIESYDTTTVRASVPMWLLCKWISDNTNIKVVLSGEGSDEIFGGYKYFKLAPNDAQFHMETIRRLMLIHQFDVLRSDRCMAAHGLEVRVPFLDFDFVYLCSHLLPELKNTRDEEKKILRDVFEGLLPSNILRRPKDAFSDAVGYNWVRKTKIICESMLTDKEFENIKKSCNNHNVPTTKEEAFYRKIFTKYYPNCDHIIKEIWRPKWTTITDPSAQQLGV